MSKSIFHLWINRNSKELDGAYNALNEDLIIKTIYQLQDRIDERFPTASLGKVCKELTIEGERNKEIIQSLNGPIWSLRGLSVIAIITVLSIVVTSIIQLASSMEPGANGLIDWIQVIESVLNELIFLAVALFFLSTIETRVKRRLALKSLHRLRSIAHVIDMHQLTKDPAYLLLLEEGEPTASSPDRTMTSFQLVRYLDYCTELLSLTSKLAALYGQYIQDNVVLTAVRELEELSNSLSSKVWQKIMILDMAVDKSQHHE